MKYSFSGLGTNILAKKNGGLYSSAEPYLSGYHFIWFDMLPSNLPTYTKNGNASLDNNADIAVVLSAACMRFTPTASGLTLANVEFPGLGGLKWGVPGNLEPTNTIGIQFLEFSKTPVYDILHGWVKMIRDYRVGATDLESGNEGIGYNKKMYSSILYYWTTAPDAKTVEYYACYDGVFPLRDPGEMFIGDISTSDRLEIEIDFHVDYAWHEEWVKTKCQSLANDLASTKENVTRIQYA